MNPPVSPPVNPTIPSTDPFTALKDIHAPLQPDFWPPSWEFWFALLLIAITALALYFALSKRKGPLWYREAVQLIQMQFKALEKQSSSAHMNTHIINLNIILKRIALSLYPRQEVAHLHSHSWCQWLDQKGRCNHFTQGVGQCLGSAAYTSQAALDTASVPLLKKCVLQWLSTQKWVNAENVSKTKAQQCAIDIQNKLSCLKQYIKQRHSILKKRTFKQDNKQHINNTKITQNKAPGETS